MKELIDQLRSKADEQNEEQRQALEALPGGTEEYLALDPVQRMKAAQRILSKYARIKKNSQAEAHEVAQPLEDGSALVFRAGVYEDHGSGVSYGGMDTSTGTWIAAWVDFRHAAGSTSGDKLMGRLNNSYHCQTSEGTHRGPVMRDESAPYGSYNRYRPLDPEGQDADFVEVIDTVCSDLLEGKIAEQRQALGVAAVTGS